MYKISSQQEWLSRLLYRLYDVRLYFLEQNDMQGFKTVSYLMQTVKAKMS